MRLLNFFRNATQDLPTPHIAVRSSLASALSLLKSCVDEILTLEGEEHAYRVSAKGWELILYADADEVDAVWYNDESGRRSSESKLAKIHRYLSRYSALADWEPRMDNGLIRYWFNPRAGVMMVYGVHKDVIRFNKFDGE